MNKKPFMMLFVCLFMQQAYIYPWVGMPMPTRRADEMFSLNGQRVRDTMKVHIYVINGKKAIR